MRWWRRNWQVLTLLIAVIVAIDVAYSILSTCDPVGEQSRQATGGQEPGKHCSLVAGALLTFAAAGLVWFGHLLEESGEAVIAVFTIVLAFSTILLWLATERLYEAGEAQRKHAETVAAQQASDMKVSLAAAQRSADAAVEFARGIRSVATATDETAEVMARTARKQLRAYVFVESGTMFNRDEPYPEQGRSRCATHGGYAH
jgi:hypothetical protein